MKAFRWMLAVLGVAAVLFISSPGVWGFGLREEFGTGGTAGGQIGQLGWAVFSIGAAPTISHDVGAYPYFGRTRLATSATSGQGGSLGLSDSTSQMLGDVSSYTNWSLTYIFGISTTGSQRLRVGMASGGNAAQAADGAWLRYDTSAGFADTTIKVECRAASTSQVIDTGLSPNLMQAGTGFIKFRMGSSSVGTIWFSINNGPRHLCDSNVPSANMFPVATLVTDTNTSKAMYFDYFAVGISASR